MFLMYFISGYKKIKTNCEIFLFKISWKYVIIISEVIWILGK